MIHASCIRENPWINNFTQGITSYRIQTPLQQRKSGYLERIGEINAPKHMEKEKHCENSKEILYIRRSNILRVGKILNKEDTCTHMKENSMR